MNTTHSMNASVAISLAQPTIQTPVTTTADRRKILVRGLLVVTSCTAGMLVFKAAMVLIDVLSYVNKTYDSSCT